jgi:hypothetical protein
MWAGRQPTVTAEESAKACASGIRDNKDLKKRVVAACPKFLASSAKLQTVAASDRLHEVKASEYLVAGFTEKEMHWLYEAQLRRKKGPGRKIYDQILVAAPFGLCVYCFHNQANTLDHFVPQAEVPGLSIEPWNLVPACSECNHRLGDYFSQQSSEQLLHPYFMPSIGRWLIASVDHTDPVVVRFAVTQDSSLAPDLLARIQNEFDRLDLGTRYSILSAKDLAGLRHRLPRQFTGAEPAEVSAHLSESAHQAFADDQNDRRAVMFEALAADEWYCAGGYAPPLGVTAREA